MEGVGKKDSKAIAARSTKDGLHLNQSGFRNPAEYYDEDFKAGFDKLDATVDQVYPMTADTGIAMGAFTISGKNAEGRDLKVSGRWSDVMVNENGVEDSHADRIPQPRKEVTKMREVHATSLF